MDEPRITQSRGAFSLACRVEIAIRATPAAIWKILSDAPGYPRWNSTVSSLEGKIQEGETLRLRPPGTKQTFTPKVSGLVPNVGMTWTGGVAPIFKGVRTFALRPLDGGATEFAMEERFSGLMLLVVGRLMPDFGPIFARFASDLKVEAEK